MTRLRPRERSAIIAGACFVCLGLLIRVALPLFRSHGDREIELELLSRRLAEAAGLVASTNQLQDLQAVANQQLLGLAPNLVDGQPTAGAATLMSLIHDSAWRSQVRVVRSEPLADSLSPPFRKIRIRTDAETDVSGLAGWLGRLEAGVPRVWIERLAVVPAAPFDTAGRLELLRIEVISSAWAIGGNN